jgi:hypothetical protein
MERPSITRPPGLQRLHLLDEHLLGIGYVAVRAGQLDHHIEEVVARAAPLFAETIATQVLGLSVPKKLVLIGEWLQIDLPKDKAAIKKFVSNTHAVRGERDEVVHRSYRKTEKDEVKEVFDPHPKGKPRAPRQVTPQYLVDLGERIMDQTRQLDSWTSKAREALIAARVKQPRTLARQSRLPNFSAMSRARLAEAQTRGQ